MTSVSETGLVEFRFYRPGATEVKVVGSFNQWSGLPMNDAGDGWWVATMKLAAGEYRFRYVADGHWFSDFAANGVECTKRGWNSIVNVRSMRITAETEQNTTEAIAA